MRWLQRQSPPPAVLWVGNVSGARVREAENTAPGHSTSFLGALPELLIRKHLSRTYSVCPKPGFELYRYDLGSYYEKMKEKKSIVPQREAQIPPAAPADGSLALVRARRAIILFCMHFFVH